MLTINAIICSLIVLRLALFVRTGQHRICMSICAYLITVAAGAEVILTLYGAASIPNYAEVFLKATLCIAIFQARGNVAHLLQPNWNKAGSRLARIPRTQTFKTKHR